MNPPEPVELPCGLRVHEKFIEWKNDLFGISNTPLDFFKWIHGAPFNEKMLEGVENFPSYPMYWGVTNIIAPQPTLKLPRGRILSNNSNPRKFIDIVKGKDLVGYLKHYYVSLDKDQCEVNLNEWISSGRLAAFETEFLRIYALHLGKLECDSLGMDIMEKFHKFSKLRAETPGFLLQSIFTFVLYETDRLRDEGFGLPEEYDFRTFFEQSLSKRQRTASSTSSETPCVNLFRI